MRITIPDLAVVVPDLDKQNALHMLHIGCGAAAHNRLPECFKDGRWRQDTLDINPDAHPDIIADVCDMRAIADNTYDAVWSSHNLEHIDVYRVPSALAEVSRVLKPGGFFLATLPDLGCIAQLVVDGRLNDVLYESAAGPVRPIDMLFGHQQAIARGNHYMAHRTGFTAQSLLTALEDAGFHNVHVRPGKAYDLWSIAVK